MIETAAMVTRELALAGMDVRLSAEESVAAFVMTPFAHLVTRASASPALDIRVTAMQSRALDVPETGIVTTSDGGDTITHLLPDCTAVYRRRAGTIDAQVREEGSASWRRAKPLQLVLSVFFADRGIDLVHAGVVSLRGNGVLFAGVGGSGKSTASIAALLDGFDFLGDDCAGVRGLEAFSVFGSGCLDREHLRNFPALGAARVDGSDAKQVVPVAGLFPERMIAATTIRAIVLPRVTHAAHVTLEPATPAEALLTLAPSSILKRAVPAADAFARIAAMVRQVPSYRMEMGPVAEIGPRIRELLESVA